MGTTIFNVIPYQNIKAKVEVCLVLGSDCYTGEHGNEQRALV